MTIEDFQLITIPGAGGSGNDHWHTYWEQEFKGTIRIEQSDWDNPIYSDWVKSFDEIMGGIKTQKPICFVAHSLGCILLAKLAINLDPGREYHALLVSPPDMNGPDFPDHVIGFQPTPNNPIRFPSLVIGSDNDPYASEEFMKNMASDWGSIFTLVPQLGHIGSDQLLKTWPAGQKILLEFLNSTND